MRILICSTALLLAACTPPAGDRSQGEPATDPTPEPGEFADLTGEYRVAGIDGGEIDKPYGIALSADDKRIWWEPGCARQGVAYEVTGSRFRVIPPTDTEPREVCEIGYPEELPAIWAAMAAANTIERTPANGISIHGGGRSVTLFSQ